jgi:hypothetical protein
VFSQFVDENIIFFTSQSNGGGEGAGVKVMSSPFFYRKLFIYILSRLTFDLLRFKSEILTGKFNFSIIRKIVGRVLSNLT